MKKRHKSQEKCTVKINVTILEQNYLQYQIIINIIGSQDFDNKIHNIPTNHTLRMESWYKVAIHTKRMNSECCVFNFPIRHKYLLNTIKFNNELSMYEIKSGLKCLFCDEK